MITCYRQADLNRPTAPHDHRRLSATATPWTTRTGRRTVITYQDHREDSGISDTIKNFQDRLAAYGGREQRERDTERGCGRGVRQQDPGRRAGRVPPEGRRRL